eukprot:4146217-Pyramimonas_sp.AAC.1
MAGHTVTTFLQLLKYEKQSGFVYFIDLRAAFHRVIRQLGIDTKVYDPEQQDITYIMQKCSIPNALKPLTHLALEAP